MHLKTKDYRLPSGLASQLSMAVMADPIIRKRGLYIIVSEAAVCRYLVSFLPACGRGQLLLVSRGTGLWADRPRCPAPHTGPCLCPVGPLPRATPAQDSASLGRSQFFSHKSDTFGKLRRRRKIIKICCRLRFLKRTPIRVLKGLDFPCSPPPHPR